MMETDTQPDSKALRLSIVKKILEKSTFSGVTGKTIAEYSMDLENYINTGELLDKTKTKDQLEWQKRSI